MSKRIANTKDKTARFGRVRIGWRKHRMLSSLEKQQEQEYQDKLDDKARQKFAFFARRVKTMIPKKFLRRYQIR